MKSITLLLALLAFASLACMTAVPVTPAPVPTATARPVEIVEYSEPAAARLGADACKLEAMTNTNLHEAASLSSDVITGDWIRKGEIISAVCNQLWAYVPRRGWVCVPALTGTGGCE